MKRSRLQLIALVRKYNTRLRSSLAEDRMTCLEGGLLDPRQPHGSDRCTTLITEPRRLLIERLAAPATDLDQSTIARLLGHGPLVPGLRKLLGNTGENNPLLRNRFRLQGRPCEPS